MCKEKHMYNHYPEQTKRNVVAVHRAGVRASTISRTLSIPRSTIKNWIESKEWLCVSSKVGSVVETAFFARSQEGITFANGF